ncbi:alpha beta fold family [Moniliophthora roreri MCA 2997]|uniref:Alpha beta fold family n=2 Tax=Moniliophthora roreri TaxID=221103 RepID=V2XZW7_MONRO|nr:alpha beta fold family [Moniliophthora roreri MCA 2997]KAI3622812.1 alpha beta fold family [Moniliophthora roreri]
MHSVISRPQPISSSSPSSPYKSPRKSSSFLSLRREKEKVSSPESYQSNHHHTPSSELPYSRPPYFDAYPKPKSSKSASSRTHRSSKSRTEASYFSDSPTSPSYEGHYYDARSVGDAEEDSIYSRSPLESHYSSLTVTDPDSGPLTPKPKSSRPRSRVSLSSRSSNHWSDSARASRVSTSSTQYTETLDTPIDNTSIRLLSVDVAAPIPGVETMDALVDGMNGGEEIMSFSSRSRFGISNHHPLYQPPLPTPPPGVILGGGKARRPKKSSKSSSRGIDSDAEDDSNLSLPVTTPSRRRRQRPSPGSSHGSPYSSAAPTPQSSEPPTPVDADSPSTMKFPEKRPVTAPTTPIEKRKSLAPSISDIIRAYAPESQARSRVPLTRSPSFSRSAGHTTVQEESEPDGSPFTISEETDPLSRTSMDSIADEVQRTLRNQTSMKPMPAPPPPSFPKRHSTMSDNVSVNSPRSEGGAASIYSSSIGSSQPPLSPFDTSNFLNSLKPQSPSQAVAQYLRSTRLTTLLKLTRSPHASHDLPLTVSLSDLGCPTGYPVLVFLGLGCVRHIMGLYDEMAECLGLRLITVDRWGLGRTEPRAKSAKGIMQWASVVEEVLDILQIDQCSVMAHSAGAPYALSFANKLRKRIRGDICLLAPWVGGSESNGYKWLKYIPNGILKTAQAAEWKLQAWMIGKPPTIAWEGIGYNATQPSSKKGDQQQSSHTTSPPNLTLHNEGPPRPSTGSAFSEYDDLRDFDGRFESRSTLGISSQGNDYSASEGKVHAATRKNSKGFLNRLKSSPNPQTSSTSEDSPSNGRRLKALRSMGSLKSKSSKKSLPPSPQLTLPPTVNNLDVGLGLDDLSWTKNLTPSDASFPDYSSGSTSTPTVYNKYATTGHSSYNQHNPRAAGRRSISFTSSASRPHISSLSPSPDSRSPNHSPDPSTNNGTSPNNGYQAALGNALIAASHAESAKGTHNDLLQILNHDNHPWGFSYQSYPHNVRIWYGDRDEKIAEHAVRWMEKTMGEDKCSVKVVKGADHGLMYKSAVVVEVLECLLQFWQDDHHRERPFS